MANFTFSGAVPSRFMRQGSRVHLFDDVLGAGIVGKAKGLGSAINGLAPALKEFKETSLREAQRTLLPLWILEGSGNRRVLAAMADLFLDSCCGHRVLCCGRGARCLFNVAE